MAEVGFEHVSKSFGRKRSVVCAIDDLSLSVSDGELLVVVGPSGCGKTTLLRLLAGLEEPASGTIRIDERIVNNAPPRDRDVAMVFQDYALYPHMTVFRNLAFGLKMRKVPKAQIEAKVVEAARWLGIEPLLERRPAALSGGERQRVAVGRAIVRHPRVFLFDEPLASLDAGLRVQMRTEIRSLHRRLHTTMIYVTHDQEEAMTLGDRIAVIRDGRLQQCGTPLEVYDRPANRFVAGFVGDPAMNLFQAPLHRDGTDVWLDCPWGRVGLCSDSTASVVEPSGENGDRVIVGIRPEDLVIEPVHHSSANSVASEHESAPATRVSMRVEAIEPLGNATNVHLRLEQTLPDGLELVARVWPRHQVTPGSQVDVTIDASRLHLFATDPQGKRLN